MNANRREWSRTNTDGLKALIVQGEGLDVAIMACRDQVPRMGTESESDETHDAAHVEAHETTAQVTEQVTVQVRGCLWPWLIRNQIPTHRQRTERAGREPRMNPPSPRLRRTVANGRESSVSLLFRTSEALRTRLSESRKPSHSRQSVDLPPIRVHSRSFAVSYLIARRAGN